MERKRSKGFTDYDLGKKRFFVTPYPKRLGEPFQILEPYTYDTHLKQIVTSLKSSKPKHSQTGGTNCPRVFLNIVILSILSSPEPSGVPLTQFILENK